MFVLDTNVISELRHGKPHQSVDVRAWAAGQPSSKLYLSALTILELEIGIQALERRMPLGCRPSSLIEPFSLRAKLVRLVVPALPSIPLVRIIESGRAHVLVALVARVVNRHPATARELQRRPAELPVRIPVEV